MTRLLWLAQGADLDALCQFPWECAWTMIGVHAHTVDGDCLKFRVSLN